MWGLIAVLFLAVIGAGVAVMMGKKGDEFT